MKKLLLLLNGTHIPMHVVKFSLETAKTNGFSLHCVYTAIEPVEQESYPFPNDLNLTGEQISTETAEQENRALLKDNVLFLRDECAVAGVTCEITENLSVQDILQLSAGADCLVVDTKADRFGLDLTELLTGVHCPVLLIAETASRIEHLVIAYDGGEGSRYAVKKFAALLPLIVKGQAHLVSVNRGNKEEDKAFVQEHLAPFPGIQIHHLEGNERTELVRFLRQYPDNGLVVMGAFGRSALSRLFHESLGHEVLKETRLSLFIAHK